MPDGMPDKTHNIRTRIKKMASIEEATRIKKNQKIALFFILVLIMGIAIMVLNSEKSKFNAGCSRCYSCIERCPVGAISLDEHGYPIINKTTCLAWNERQERFQWDKCGLCLRACPTKVIDLVNTDSHEREIKTVD